MSFAITCPACQFRFRSSKERELGKGVQCKKCGEQFYVSAENQEKVQEKQYGPPPVPKSGRAKDEEPVRDSRRRRDEEDDNEYEDDRPAKGSKKPKKRRGKLLLLIFGSAAAILLVSAVAVVLLFVKDEGWSAPSPRAQRELPADMFAYVPNPVHNVSYADYTLMRELGDPTIAKTIEYHLPKDSGIAADRVLVTCASRPSFNSQEEIQLVCFSGQQDVGAIANRCKLLPIAGLSKPVFGGKIGSTHWMAFQATPTKIVFIRNPLGGAMEQPRLKALLDRDPTTSTLPTELREGFVPVSGYPRIEGHTGREGYDGLGMSQFSGSFINAERVKEWYSFQHFKSVGAAKGWFAGPKIKFKEPQKKPEGELENYRWQRGDKIYMFQRTQLKE